MKKHHKDLLKHHLHHAGYKKTHASAMVKAAHDHAKKHGYTMAHHEGELKGAKEKKETKRGMHHVKGKIPAGGRHYK